MLLLPPFCPFRPKRAGDAAKTAPFSRNTPATRPKPPLSPGIRRRYGRKRAFSSGICRRCGQKSSLRPKRAAARLKKSLSPEMRWRHPRSKPFAESYTKKRMEKNPFRTPPRGLCGGFFFSPAPLRRCAPSSGAPFNIEETLSVGGAACTGDFSAPVNGGVPPIGGLPLAALRAWRPFRTHQRRLVFEKVSAFAASAAFSLKRGECFT